MIDTLLEKIPEIQEKLKYVFSQKHLLVLAFIHRSFYHEQRHQIDGHNERLEFLGDSVLELLVSSYLYKTFPHIPEGDLSQLRARIVDAGACASYVQKLGVGAYILLGKGEKLNEGKGRETIFSDLFEAIIGAIYLDGGLECAKTFFFTHFLTDLENISKNPLRNWKAELQDFAQKRYQTLPIYKLIQESGPDHDKLFVVSAFIHEKEVGQGKGSSKKQAEAAAAEHALLQL